ncbi:hypothetical protein COUCH_36710 [Couchioplanes caeruleus]|uniref:hypothetical protein n=1 Tax=Couchioplanes caeruleus TaxID=56438 RepID=UPI0020C00FF2|nr:hypothetical protein [Couchioplanes caeruleus]UQU64439.1 hypothetical protein COUCH_36710 [Couchioplanes caeruleus]
MIHSCLFLGEGPSDEGIQVHIARIAAQCGVEIQLTSPNSEMLPTPDKTIAGKLRAVKQLGGIYEVVFVHRDADGAGRDARLSEISIAVREVTPGSAHVPIVPVRMTEAWLILDEPLIRIVAGNPNGRIPLDIPSVREAERVADPKALLKNLILTASETTGRRRRNLQAALPPIEDYSKSWILMAQFNASTPGDFS